MTCPFATAARSVGREQPWLLGCDTNDHGGAVRRAHLLLASRRPTMQPRAATRGTAARRRW